MRLASQRDGTRDGGLVVVSRDGSRAVRASEIAPSLQRALDDWDRTGPSLRRLSEMVEQSERAQPTQPGQWLAPLPRAFEWIDGSAFLSHVRLVRQARGAALPPALETAPLMYQGGSGVLLGPTADVPLGDAHWGLDFEAEVCVIVGDVPRGVSVAESASYVRLVLVACDWTYRNLVPAELQRGFGFLQSKPATSFAPFAVTPDELGESWRDGRIHLRVRTRLNGQTVGELDAGTEMHFSFFDLIAHAARTRSLTAGTIIGSGTVSQTDGAGGVSCIAETRMRETIDTGTATTGFLRAGDRVEIELLDPHGRSLCGATDQRIVSGET